MTPASIFTAIVGIGGIGLIIYKVRNLDRYRREEHAARDFFDAHGHWPEETLEDAAAEREAITASIASQQYTVSEPDEEGRV